MCFLDLPMLVVQVGAELQDGFWQLQSRNSGVSMDAATLAAFAADAGDGHAAHDPFSRMRTGLRFAAQLMRVAGGGLSAAPAGTGRKGGCIITVKLPAARTEAACAPTILLQDGTSSTEKLAAAEVLAALERNADSRAALPGAGQRRAAEPAERLAIRTMVCSCALCLTSQGGACVDHHASLDAAKQKDHIPAVSAQKLVRITVCHGLYHLHATQHFGAQPPI